MDGDVVTSPHDGGAAAPDEGSDAYGPRQWIGGLIGPALLAATLVTAPPEGLSVAGWRTAGAAGLMAVFWITEAIPIPATALLPLVLFPALGLGDVSEAAAPFANPTVFLFLGGFIIALAMQRWNLHRRVAVAIISRLGTQPSHIVAGFLIASAVVSMWVSNTATALMMLPIALSVAQLLPPGSRSREHQDFGSALLLAVAYGATAGGMATLIGTPPNALLAAYMTDVYGVTIGFGQWMLLGVPAMLAMLPVMYVVLTRTLFVLGDGALPGMASLIEGERASQGRMNRGELAVALVFAATAIGWILQPAIARVVPLVTDTTVAMAGALVLFMIPARGGRGGFVMTWEATRALPWGVLLLFGGGLSLAGMVEKHGLASFLGSMAVALDGVPTVVLLSVFVIGLVLLGELASNTAAAATFLPVAGALAISVGENPLLFLIPTVLAASCSFMLPVGTPPNAIVYASGLVPLQGMVRVGLLLDLLMVPVMLGLMLVLGRAVFGIEPGVVPDWAR